MGYHLTILRSANGKQLPISLEEAKLAARGLGWEFSDDPPTFELSLDEGTAVLWHQDAELWTTNPDDRAIAPMVALANALPSRIRRTRDATPAGGRAAARASATISVQPKQRRFA